MCGYIRMLEGELNSSKCWALNTSTTATTTISTIHPGKSEQGTNNEIKIKVFSDVTLCQLVNSDWHVKW